MPGGVLLGPGGGECLPGAGGGFSLVPRGGLPGPGGGFSLVPGGSTWSRGGSPWSWGGVCLVLGGFSGDPTPPVNRITDTCKNITLATTSLRPVKISERLLTLLTWT